MADTIPVERVPFRALPVGQLAREARRGKLVPIEGAQVLVFKMDGGRAKVYANASGPEVLHQPLVTDSLGNVPGYLPVGAEVDVIAAYAGVEVHAHVEVVRIG